VRIPALHTDAVTGKALTASAINVHQYTSWNISLVRLAKSTILFEAEL